MKKFLNVIFILFVIVNLSFGQNYAKKGVVEFSGAVSYSSVTEVYDGTSDNNSIGVFTFAPQVSYFFIDGFQVGLMPTYVSTSYGGSTSSTLGIYASPGYVFDLRSNVYPYVNALLGYNSISASNSSSETGFGFGVQGGIKILLGKMALVNIGLEYLATNTTPSGWNGGRIGANNIQFLAGFSIFIGK
jgi:hypothetical protein